MAEPALVRRGGPIGPGADIGHRRVAAERGRSVVTVSPDEPAQPPARSSRRRRASPSAAPTPRRTSRGDAGRRSARPSMPCQTAGAHPRRSGAAGVGSHAGAAHCRTATLAWHNRPFGVSVDLRWSTLSSGAVSSTLIRARVPSASRRCSAVLDPQAGFRPATAMASAMAVPERSEALASERRPPVRHDRTYLVTGGLGRRPRGGSTAGDRGRAINPVATAIPTERWNDPQPPHSHPGSRHPRIRGAGRWSGPGRCRRSDRLRGVSPSGGATPAIGGVIHAASVWQSSTAERWCGPVTLPIRARWRMFRPGARGWVPYEAAGAA